MSYWDSRSVTSKRAKRRIMWKWKAFKKDEREGTIDFTNYYFVTTRDQVKIFGYIAGDEQKALADSGLMAETEAR